MTSSTGKIIGLILLVIFILILVSWLTPLVFAPFAIFPGFFHFARIPNWGEMWSEHGPFAFLRFATLSFVSLALFILWIMVIVWVYRDAERRGMNGILWALLVLIGSLVGLLIYLIVRSEHVPVKRSAQTCCACPKCQKPVNSNFIFCPDCGARLQAVCPGCNRPVESSWRVCPHCGQKLSP